jgi:Zn-dependent protease with chaperone function
MALERSTQPAAVAATRVARAGALLGALGLASSMFVVSRLLEAWRVAPTAASHEVSIIGERLSYPAANFAAVVVLALALVGLAVTVLTVAGAVGEVLAARRFARALRNLTPRPFEGAWLSGVKRPIGDAWVIPDERPRAFCAGLIRPAVYVSSGAVALLDDAALGAVLAHERHHARRHDPLRLAAGRVGARALFFVPGLRELLRRQQSLAELSADESAIAAAPENRAALAQAMLSFVDESADDPRAGVDPARVDHLLGEPSSWRFPLLLCMAAAALIALLVAVAALAGQLAVGSTTLAPPLLSSRPCVVVLAAIPAVVGLVALRLRRRAVWERPRAGASRRMRPRPRSTIHNSR